MILLIVCAAAIVAVIVTLILLVRSDRWDGSRDYDYAGQHRTAEPLQQPADEDTIAWMQRLAGEQRGAAHEEYLPAAPPVAATAPLDDFMTVPIADAPVSPRRVPAKVWRMGRARAYGRVLPPMLAPAFGVAATFAAMAQRVAANEHREAARLRAEVARLQEHAQELQNRLDFAHLFGPDVEYDEQRDWLTDSGILRAIDAGELPVAVPA